MSDQPAMGSVFFVEAAQTGSGLAHVRWACQAQYDVWFITSSPDKYAGAIAADVLPLLRERGRLCVVEQTERPPLPEGCVRAAAGAPAPRGVICVTDRHLSFAAQLAATIGARFPSVDAVAVARDKRAARELFSKLGLPSIRWASAESSADVRAFARQVAGPIIIKNSRGTGSLNVEFCLGADRALETFGRMLANPRYLDGPLMLEEYLFGPLLSLEVLVIDGVPHSLGVTDRQLGPLPHFCEVSYSFPVQVPETVLRGMEQSVLAIVRHLQIGQGLLHVEFIATSEGPKLVELNMRLGGGLLPRMMDDCLSSPTPRLLVESALGRLRHPPETNGCFSSTITVYPSGDCILRDLSCLEAAGGVPHIREIVPCAQPGALLHAARDYRGAVCQIRSTADSAALAFNSAQTAQLLVLHALERQLS